MAEVECPSGRWCSPLASERNLDRLSMAMADDVRDDFFEDQLGLATRAAARYGARCVSAIHIDPDPA